jgi:hypothetical protein
VLHCIALSAPVCLVPLCPQERQSESSFFDSAIAELAVPPADCTTCPPAHRPRTCAGCTCLKCVRTRLSCTALPPDSAIAELALYSSARTYYICYIERSF